jgi:hypothetical protein
MSALGPTPDIEYFDASYMKGADLEGDRQAGQDADL